MGIIISLLVTLIAVSGFGYAWHRFFKIGGGSMPISGIITVTLITYLFGICGQLRIGVYVTAGLGAALLIAGGVEALLKKRQREMLSPVASFGFLFFCAVCVLLTVRLCGKTFTQYDNFSHWGLVWKEVMRTGALSNPTQLLQFPKYPPATVTFLYWFCSFGVSSEGAALTAQGILMLAACCVLFRKDGKRNTLYAVPLVIAALFVMEIYDNGTIAMDNLLVDGLLGCLFGAALSLAFVSSESGQRSEVVIALILCFMAITKDIGALFGIFVVVLWYLWNRKGRSLTFSRLRLDTVCLFCAPLAVAASWRFYLIGQYGASVVFEKIPNAVKIDGIVRALPMAIWIFLIIAVSVALSLLAKEVKYGHWGVISPIILVGILGATSLFKKRSDGFFGEVIGQYLKSLFQISSKPLQMFLAVNAVLLFSFFLFREEGSRRVIKRAWIGGVGLTLAYYLVLLVFYLGILPEDEAIVLAAFDRYITSELIAFAMISFTALLSVEESKLPAMPALAAALVILLLARPYTSQLVFGTPYEENKRNLVQDAYDYAASRLPQNASIMIYTGEEGEKGYFYHLAVYSFATRAVMILDYSEIEVGIPEDTNRMWEFDYLILAAEPTLLEQTLQTLHYDDGQQKISVRYQDGVSLYRKTEPGGTVYYEPVE